MDVMAATMATEEKFELGVLRVEQGKVMPLSGCRHDQAPQKKNPACGRGGIQPRSIRRCV